MSLEQLLTELRERDPAAYAAIDRQNPRRVIRAVEVLRLTGKKLSEQRAAWEASARRPEPAPRFFCLTRTPDDLRRRINARVEEMFARGLVEETRQLMAQSLDQNRTAMQAIGYRQVVEHLRGERGLAETIELVKIRTRQFCQAAIDVVSPPQPGPMDRAGAGGNRRGNVAKNGRFLRANALSPTVRRGRDFSAPARWRGPC